MLRDPLAKHFLDRNYKLYSSWCDESKPGAISSYWCVLYFYIAGIHDMGHEFCGEAINLGQYFNPNDVSDMGYAFGGPTTLNGSTGVFGPYNEGFPYTKGDLVRPFDSVINCARPSLIDQIDYARWYRMINVDNTAHTFQLEDPANPGKPMISYTQRGVVINTQLQLLWRPQYSHSTGFATPNYVQYMGQILNALQIAGYDVSNVRRYVGPRGIDASYNSSSLPGIWWDPTINVP